MYDVLLIAKASARSHARSFPVWRTLLQRQPFTYMKSRHVPAGFLDSFSLGDVVTVPGSEPKHVSSVATLREKPFGVKSFCTLGESEAALVEPSAPFEPLVVYSRVKRFMPSSEELQTVASGASRYWPPHTPGVVGAMGEVYYRVLAVKGVGDPVLVVYRGPDVSVLIRSGFVHRSRVSVLHLDVDDSADMVDVPRYSGAPVRSSQSADTDVYSLMTRRT